MRFAPFSDLSYLFSLSAGGICNSRPDSRDDVPIVLGESSISNNVIINVQEYAVFLDLTKGNPSAEGYGNIIARNRMNASGTCVYFGGAVFGNITVSHTRRTMDVREASTVRDVLIAGL